MGCRPQEVYGFTDEAHAGLLVGGDGTLLAAQFLTAVVICVWTVVTCLAAFCAIKYLPKKLGFTEEADCLRVPLLVCLSVGATRTAYTQP